MFETLILLLAFSIMEFLDNYFLGQFLSIHSKGQLFSQVIFIIYQLLTWR